MKIIIIGAGLSGLTMGLACERSGIDYHIYEKTPALRNIGGGVIIWPHGLRYLQWLGLSHCIEPLKMTATACNIKNAHGQLLYHEDFASLNQLLNGSVLPVDRSQLQQSLLAALPTGKVTLGKRCIGIEQTRAHFADGTEARGDLIIGADGVHSKIRNLINADARLEYTGHCWWGGIVEAQHVPNLPLREVYFAVGLNKICVMWPLKGKRFMWYIPVGLRESALEPDNRKAQIQSMCADWDNPDIQQLLAAPPCAQEFHLPIHALAPQSKISANATVLIGDAAHAIGPILGQGISLAIEDVFVLVQCLKQYDGDMHALLQRYESLRCGRYLKIHELETQSAATMINDDEEKLAQFEEQMQHINLAMMYQELIPLVNENASLAIASQLLQHEAA